MPGHRSFSDPSVVPAVIVDSDPEGSAVAPVAVVEEVFAAVGGTVVVVGAEDIAGLAWLVVDKGTVEE